MAFQSVSASASRSSLFPRQPLPIQRQSIALPNAVQLTKHLYVFPHDKSTPGGHWLDAVNINLPAQAYGILSRDRTRMLLLDAVWPDSLQAAITTCAATSATLSAHVITHDHFLPLSHPDYGCVLATAASHVPHLALPAAAAIAHHVPQAVQCSNVLAIGKELQDVYGIRLLCWMGHSGADLLLLWEGGGCDGAVLFTGDCATGPSMHPDALRHAQLLLHSPPLYGSAEFFQRVAVSPQLTRLYFFWCGLFW